MRPELGALFSVVSTAALLRGEKSAPELPIPFFALQRYVEERGYSSAFASLVWAYEHELLTGAMAARDQKLKAARKKTANVVGNTKDIKQVASGGR